MFKQILKVIAFSLSTLILAFILWQVTKVPPMKGDWQPKVAVLPTVKFNGDLVTIQNVRNFTYESGKELEPTVAYYDKTYDISKLTKVWYVTEPFKPGANVAHTFLSFEFSDGNFLSITIESRLKKGQVYNAYYGMLHSYPLIYIAADERDAIYLRANVRKSYVYLYPVNTTPERGRLLLRDMLEKMDSLSRKSEWYNSIFANCTSMIAMHINKLFPKRLPVFTWQEFLTGHADELALKRGLLATDLPIEKAREKFLISPRSQSVGYSENYSRLIRQYED